MASPKYLNGIDLGLTQLLNSLFQVLASDPGSPTEGQFWYNSTTQSFKYRNATTTISLAAASTDATTLGGQAGSYYLARANHTGSQAASTISDLASVVQGYRLDQFAAPTADVSFNSHKITNLLTPTAANDAANKSYVDGVAQGLEIHTPVRVASTANVTVSSAPATIDGVTLAANDRVLLKNQTAGAENGIYVFAAAASALTRATDATNGTNLGSGSFTFVTEGTANDNTGWVLTTNNPITIGTTALTFAQFSGAGTYTSGTGITITGGVVAQDTANGYGVRKYSVAIGDGSTTAITVTHNLGVRSVTVSVAQAATPWAIVHPDIAMTTVNTLTLTFAVAPASGAYTVTVVG